MKLASVIIKKNSLLLLNKALKNLNVYIQACKKCDFSHMNKSSLFKTIEMYTVQLHTVLQTF